MHRTSGYISGVLSAEAMAQAQAVFDEVCTAFDLPERHPSRDLIAGLIMTIAQSHAPQDRWREAAWRLATQLASEHGTVAPPMPERRASP